jgi:hypothetical protein
MRKRLPGEIIEGSFKRNTQTQMTKRQKGGNNQMKAITILQPWASLIALGAKKFETRSWKTSYQGPIAIHAGKKPFRFIPGYCGNVFLNALADTLRITRIGEDESEGDFLRRFEKHTSQPGVMPLGAVIATAELVGCCLIDKIQEMSCAPWETGCWDGDHWIDPTTEELIFGDWRPGRFAWELKKVRKLPVPIPARGRQGLWEWDEMGFPRQ